ncbi:MAG: UDP-N-acetylmuramoyl-L-alanine--D-glutamate ligase [Rickettsiaceae bacterium]
MKLISQQGKKIGVIGLGITGNSVFDALQNIASTIVCWDDSEANRIKFKALYGDSYLHNIDHNIWLNLDKIVVSPGIPNSHPIFAFIKKHNLLISSDIQLFLEENINSKIIAITGTNGKSTTTSLISHILKANSLNYFLGGNIGNPVLTLPAHANGYVLELSSFQIELLPDFNPDIVVLLNITPDHLDRHGNFIEYCRVKAKALKGEGIKIIGIDSLGSKERYLNLKDAGDTKLIPISTYVDYSGVSCQADKIVDKFFNNQVYPISKLNSLLGKHNQENIAASFSVCRCLGLMPSEILPHFESFQGLKHRMQYLGKKNNISYYNDSKATNVVSAVCSLVALENTLWLAGGILKEDSLNSLDPAILNNVLKVYLFGESQEVFVRYLKNRTEYEVCSTMQEAFTKANQYALLSEQDVNILLAPACSSFDQFNNFEDRGNQFIELYEQQK